MTGTSAVLLKSLATGHSVSGRALAPRRPASGDSVLAESTPALHTKWSSQLAHVALKQCTKIWAQFRLPAGCYYCFKLCCCSFFPFLYVTVYQKPHKQVYMRLCNNTQSEVCGDLGLMLIGGV